MQPPQRVHVEATAIYPLGFTEDGRPITVATDMLVHMRRDQYEPWRAGAPLALVVHGRCRAPALPQLQSQLVGATPQMLARLVLEFEDHACTCIPTPARPPEDGLHRRQERAILDTITAMGLEALALPRTGDGLSGVRYAIRQRAFADDHQELFKHVGLADVAFQRLLKAGLIAYG